MLPKILDFGCGNGSHDEIGENRLSLIHWLEHNGGQEAVGIDVNPSSIEQIRTSINNGTCFYVMDGCRMSFPDGTFQMVHEHGVFHHIKYYREAIKEVARVLRPGGLFLVKETVSNDRVYHLARVLTQSWRSDPIQSFFTTEDLKEDLQPYFEIEDIQYYWRFALSDMLLELGLDGPRSLKFNLWMNQIWVTLGIKKQMCCHCVIKARRI